MLHPLAVPLQGDETADLRLGAAYSSPPVQFLPLVKLSTPTSSGSSSTRVAGAGLARSARLLLRIRNPLLVLPFYHRHFIGESIQTLEKTLT